MLEFFDRVVPEQAIIHSEGWLKRALKRSHFWDERCQFRKMMLE